MSELIGARSSVCQSCGTHVPLTNYGLCDTCRTLMAAESVTPPPKEAVNHPSHYGGADNVYEAIKVIDAWKLSFCLGNVLKYILRADRKGNRKQDLEKAMWYLDHEIKQMK